MTEHCNKDPRGCWNVRCQLGKKCIGGQATALHPVAMVVPHEATVRLEWASVEAAHNAKPGPLYTRAAVQAAQPEAVGWKLVPIEPTREMIEAYLKGTSAGFYSARSDWANMLAYAPTPEPMSAPTAEPDERSAFEIELRKQCFQKPTPEAYDLAWSMWKARALSAPTAPAQAEPVGNALQIADAIDPFTRKQAPDHLTMGVAASLLRALATPPSAATPEPSDAERYQWICEQDHKDRQWVETFAEFKAMRDARIDAAIRATKGGTP